MRRTKLVMAAVAVTLATSSVHAGPSTRKLGHEAKPPAPNVKIVTVKKIEREGSGPYDGLAGGITFGFDVSNPFPETMKSAEVFLGYGVIEGGIFEYLRVVDLPPGMTHVSVTPNDAALSTVPFCSPSLNLWAGFVPNGQQVYDANMLTAKPKLACTFTATAQSPWDTIEPDRLAAEEAGVVYIDGVSMNNVACGVAVYVDVRVTSHAKKASSTMWLGRQFSIAPGETKTVQINSTTAFTPGSRIPIQLSDEASAVPVANQQGYVAIVGESCTFTMGPLIPYTSTH